MSRLQLVKHAIRLWKVTDVPRDIYKSNTRKWIASVERLGDRWLFAKKYTCEELKSRMQ